MGDDKDFLRGADEVASHLAKVHDGKADVNAKTDDDHWDTYTKLAWRPAWSIRSRRGALRPLIAGVRSWFKSWRDR